MNKYTKRKFKWGVGLLVFGFILFYIVIENSPLKSMIEGSAMFGPLGLLMSWPVIFSSPLAIVAFFMIIFGMGLLIKLAIEKMRVFFGIPQKRVSG